jgi:hypothetical protein
VKQRDATRSNVQHTYLMVPTAFWLIHQAVLHSYTLSVELRFLGHISDAM